MFFDYQTYLMFYLGLLNGVLEIDALNKGYVRLHVGILGFNVDVATADQCFDGAIEIRINTFKVICIVKIFSYVLERIRQKRYRLKNRFKPFH